jgi:hypothetical protein
MMRALVLVAMLLAGGGASAQPAGSGDTNTNVQQQRRDKIKQRIRALRAYTLTEQLELDEATAAKLFPALAKYDEELDKLLAQRADLQRRLKDAGSLGDAKAVDKVIDEAVVNQKAIWDTETRRLEQLRKILTPAQVARTLVVLPQMERRIQNQLRRVVQKNRQGGGRRGSNDEAPPGENNDAWDSDGLKNPFDAPRPRPKGRPAPKSKTCDPFGSMTGCR